MKKLVAAAAALGAMLGVLVLAAPAGAQDYRADHRGMYDRGPAGDTGYQLERLRMRLRDGVRDGDINQFVARRLFDELRSVQELRFQYMRSRGLSEWEADDLQSRIHTLRFEIRQQLAEARGRYRGQEDHYQRHDDRPETRQAPPDAPDDDLSRPPDYGDDFRGTPEGNDRRAVPDDDDDQLRGGPDEDDPGDR